MRWGRPWERSLAVELCMWPAFMWPAFGHCARVAEDCAEEFLQGFSPCL